MTRVSGNVRWGHLVWRGSAQGEWVAMQQGGYGLVATMHVYAWEMQAMEPLAVLVVM